MTSERKDKFPTKENREYGWIWSTTLKKKRFWELQIFLTNLCYLTRAVAIPSVDPRTSDEVKMSKNSPTAWKKATISKPPWLGLYFSA